jgi:hypothetical protein
VLTAVVAIHLGSKSKAVTFGAEAMPDNDLVTFGTTEEFEAALM